MASPGSSPSQQPRQRQRPRMPTTDTLIDKTQAEFQGRGELRSATAMTVTSGYSAICPALSGPAGPHLKPLQTRLQPRCRAAELRKPRARRHRLQLHCQPGVSEFRVEQWRSPVLPAGPGRLELCRSRVRDEPGRGPRWRSLSSGAASNHARAPMASQKPQTLQALQALLGAW